MSEEQARDRLRRLGKRRRRLNGQRERLAEETKREIAATVGRGRVSPTEAAKLTGVHRSTVYEALKASD